MATSKGRSLGLEYIDQVGMKWKEGHGTQNELSPTLLSSIFEGGLGKPISRKKKKKMIRKREGS